nr:MAG TPA: major capsid protein [Caudoviricetes sp.]
MLFWRIGLAQLLSLRKNKRLVIKLKVAIHIVAFFNKKITVRAGKRGKGDIYMSFKTIETQEELDRIIGERIKREREKYADYESLTESVKKLEKEKADLLNAIEGNSQLLQEKDGVISAKDSELAELQKTNDSFKKAQLRTQIAVRNGIPYDLAERLQGDDEESLQADAERLSELIKPQTIVAPMKDTEPVVGDERTVAMKQMIKDLNQ